MSQIRLKTGVEELRQLIAMASPSSTPTGTAKNRGFAIQGSRLLAAMEKAGLSIDQVARAIDVHRSAVYRWTKNNNIPRSDHLVRLTMALGVSPGYLVGLTDDQGGDPRQDIAAFVENSLGAIDGEFVRLMGELSAEDRERLLDVARAWIQGRTGKLPTVRP